MHPLLSRVASLTVYLGLWLVLGLVWSGGLAARAAWPWPAALLGALPLSLAYGLVCLAPWYVCRAFPLEGARTALVVLLAHVAAAVLTGVVWVAVGVWWLRAQAPGAAPFTRDAAILLLAAGVLLFLLSSAVHYVFLGLEAQDLSRRQALESAVLAREAELRALRAQVNPHFLFNSLHSIGALAGTRPEAAREMAIGLGEFLRQSLRLGGLACVPLSQELDLLAQYLAIEQVRFGSRLAVRIDVSAEARACALPPLLLQPLVENAIKHGVAGMLDGGVVSIAGRCVQGRCELSIGNSFDAEAVPGTGTGTGLRNVRARLAAHYGAAATLDVSPADGTFVVSLAWPVADALVGPSTEERR
ncbi:MAG: sensor histidine kinase [Luteitalea sp.]